MILLGLSSGKISDISRKSREYWENKFNVNRAYFTVLATLQVETVIIDSNEAKYSVQKIKRIWHSLSYQIKFWENRFRKCSKFSGSYMISRVRSYKCFLHLTPIFRYVLSDTLYTTRCIRDKQSTAHWHWFEYWIFVHNQQTVFGFWEAHVHVKSPLEWTGAGLHRYVHEKKFSRSKSGRGLL